MIPIAKQITPGTTVEFRSNTIPVIIAINDNVKPKKNKLLPPFLISLLSFIIYSEIFHEHTCSGLYCSIEFILHIRKEVK